MLSGRATGSPKSRDGLAEAIRVLRVVYRGAVRDRTAAINQFHALVLTAPAQIREEAQKISTKQRIERARRWRDRDGDDGNHALRRIAMVRLTCEQRTRNYMARRTAEGLSERDVMRSLKRYIAREIYKVLTNPPALAPRGAELRRLRTQAGLPLRVVAEQFDITIQQLSRIERAITRDPATQTRIHTWFMDTTSLPNAA